MDRASLKTRRHSRKLKYRPPALNLVSMMDIFTILLLFLITLSGDETVLPPPTNLVLPKSSSDTIPKPTINIMITGNNIIVAGREVAKVSDVETSNSLVIARLQQSLQEEMFKGRLIGESNKDVRFEGKLTILADKNIPFKLIKKVMYTATRSNFPNISLAVIKK